MTNLGNDIIKYIDKYVIYLSVSGDLSHSYQVTLASSVQNGTMGVGYGFPTLKEALASVKVIKKLGYGSEAMRTWYEKTDNFGHLMRFRYLPPAKAKKYLKYAYGDYADKLRGER